MRCCEASAVPGFFDVRGFGAVGDGERKNTDAIPKAIAAPIWNPAP
ncbi:MAG: hypothetical protein ABUS79_02685 [Pseudomonadota bacterium]